MELVRAEMEPDAKGDDRLFLANTKFRGKSKKVVEIQKKPLVWSRTSQDGKLKKSDSIGHIFWRLQQKTNINGSRGFYCLRKTGATLIETIDPACTEMYLAHAEPGMKRAYAQRDWTRLERALVELERVLGLVVPGKCGHLDS